jgi:hypothetical protein
MQNSLNWNICEKTARRCLDSKDDYANVVNENNTCNHVSETTEENKQPGFFHMIDEQDAIKGVRLQYTNGDRC